MVSALGDEHTPTTAVVTTALESYAVALPNSVSVSALVPAVHRQPGSPGPETVLTVCYYVAIMIVIIPNYYSFSACLRTLIVQQCPPCLTP
jgi:hypothetical protein